MAESRLNLIIQTKGEEKLRRLRGDADKADKELSQLQGGLDDVGRSAGRAQSGIGKLNKALRGLGSVIAGAAIGDQLRRAFGAAAEAEGAAIRARNVTKAYEQLAGIQDVAAQSAEKFGISNAQALSDLTDLGSRLGSTGRSLDDIKDIYEGFNTVLVNNAVGTQQAAAAQLQLNQALGSGRLAGEEFNAINEATPQVIDAVADVLKVARGEVKGLAADGKVSADVLVAALRRIKTDGADQLEDSLAGPAGQLRQFDAAVKDFQVTIGQQLLPVITPLVSQLTKLLKLFGQLPGPVKALVVGITALGAAFAILAPAIGLTVSGLAALAPLIPGLLTVAALAAPYAALAVAVGAVGVAVGAYYVEQAKLNRIIDGFDTNLQEATDALAGKKKELAGAEQKLRDLQSAGTKNARAIQAQTKRVAELRDQLKKLEGTYRVQIIIEENRARLGINGADIRSSGAGSRGRQGTINARRQAALDAAANAAGSSSSSGSSGSQRESQIPQLQGQLELKKALFDIDQKIRAAELDGNRALQERLAAERIGLELAGQTAAINREDIPQAEKQLKIDIARVEANEKLGQLAFDQLQASKQLAESKANALRPIQDEIALLQASLSGDEAKVQRAIDIRDLTNERLGITKEMATALVDERNGLLEIKKEADKLNEIFAQVGAEIKSALVDSITAAIDGSKDLQAIWADTLKSIGRFLINAGLSSIGGPGGAFGAKGIPGFSQGGVASAGKPALVGENGPEIIRPLTTTAVIPNDAFGEARDAIRTNASASDSVVDAFADAQASIGSSASVMQMKAQGAAQQSMMDGGSVSVDVKTVNVGGLDVVSTEQFAAGMEATAKKARAQVFNALKNKPAARAGVGV